MSPAGDAAAAFDDAIDATTVDISGIPVAFPYAGSAGVGAVLTRLPKGVYDVYADVIDFGAGGGTRVASLTVEFDTTRTPTRQVHLADLGVDAGLMWVGDPAAFVAPGAPVDNRFGDWMDFCEAMEDVRLYASPCGTGRGVVSSTGFGDGAYPLIGHVAEGDLLTAVTIIFIDD